jgi:NAD(P)-dependent dehydrogenase (short-subunit alcohol dehydrogenase family)
MGEQFTMTYLDQMFALTDRVAVVTGATRGLGLAIADGLLRAGATVILVGSNEQRLDEAVTAFKDEGLLAFPFRCDLAEPQQIEGLVEYVAEQHERIDVLVNNAGVTFSADILDYPDEAWRKTMQVNLNAPFQLSKQFAAMMKDQGSGSIINITSLAAEMGFPNNPAYIAAKGALKQLTKSLAVDLGPFGIRVNNGGPGYFKTDMNSASWNDPQRREDRTRRSLLGRWGNPEDMAGAVIFLASDASSYITGQDLYVDGGWLTKGL